ncbi:hypothetical protein J2Y46_000146 [Microbacterium sp. BE35]|nr:hypothetical protein [Microbacterium sp. BE35]
MTFDANDAGNGVDGILSRDQLGDAAPSLATAAGSGVA